MSTDGKVTKKYKTGAVARRGAKSRKGCGTCKIRKVKCDEVKPFCVRCKTAGIICDGYLLVPPRATTTTTQSKASSSRNMLILPAPVALHSTLRFESTIEASLFDHFRTKLAPELAGTFETGFFSHLVLQSAHSEPFILKAVIALSALSTSQKLRANTPVISHQHYALAFNTYQTAVQSMSSSLSQQASPRKALLMCLLICAFEGLSGNTYTALSHARSGQKLLEEWQTKNPFLENELWKEGIASSRPTEVEDELIRACAFFKQQISGLFDSRENPSCPRASEFGKITVSCMPDVFRDVEEARRYWAVVRRRVMDFILESLRNVSKAQSLDGEFKSPESSEAPSSSERPDSETNGNTHEFQKEAKRPSLFPRQKELFGEVQRFRAAFSPLYENLKRSNTHPGLLAAAHVLALQSLMDFIVTNGMGSEQVVQADIPAGFREMLDLARLVIAYKNAPSTPNKSGYVFELGIVPALHMIAKYCNTTVFQKEAVKLLREYGKREGNWDSLTLAEIDQVYMDLEAEGEGSYKLGKEIQNKAEKRLIVVLRGNEKQIGYVGGVHGKFADARNMEMQLREVRLNWVEMADYKTRQDLKSSKSRYCMNRRVGYVEPEV